MASDTGHIADDAMAQIAMLREQVEALMRDHVTPALNAAGATAQDAVGTVREKAEMVSGKVREQPLTALLIVAAAGFLLGRSLR